MDSDRSTLQFSLTTCVSSHQQSKWRKLWLYKQVDFKSPNDTLQCLPTSIYSQNGINIFWTDWYDVFMTVIDECIPSKTIKPKTRMPYVTAGLLHLVHKKCRLFNCAKKVGTTKTCSKYSKIRNHLHFALQRKCMVIGWLQTFIHHKISGPSTKNLTPSTAAPLLTSITKVSLPQTIQRKQPSWTPSLPTALSNRHHSFLALTPVPLQPDQLILSNIECSYKEVSICSPLTKSTLPLDLESDATWNCKLLHTWVTLFNLLQ